jgi:hypothetical protein
MKLKNLTFALLFVASSLFAEPLTWHFYGTAGSGKDENGNPVDSTYKGKSVNGAKFDLQIILNTNLRGVKSDVGNCIETVCFDGPFRAQVSIAGTGTVPVDLFFQVANGGSVPQRNVTSVITFSYGDFGEQLVTFDHSISSTPLRLTPIVKTPLASPPQNYGITGPNLEVFGKVDSFSATTGAVVLELPGNGRTPSAPGVVTGTLKKAFILDVFVRGNDDGIYANSLHAGVDGTDFTGWFEIPPGNGATIFPPAAVIHNGILKVFVTNPDHFIYQNTFKGSPAQPDIGWTGWVEVTNPQGDGGRARSGVAAVVYQGILKLFIRGFDDEIWENDFVSGSFTGWDRVPGHGVTLSTPAAVVHNNVLKLFIRGADDGIYENDFDATGWHEVHGGGITTAAPSALVDNGVLKLFVKGFDDDAVWENDFNGTSFGEWSRVSSISLTPSAPAAVEAFKRYPTIFLRGETGKILQCFF